MVNTIDWSKPITWSDGTPASLTGESRMGCHVVRPMPQAFIDKYGSAGLGDSVSVYAENGYITNCEDQDFPHIVNTKVSQLKDLAPQAEHIDELGLGMF